MGPIFNRIKSVKFDYVRFNELILEVCHVEFIVASNVEISNTEITVDDIQLFAGFSQDNELFFIGDEIWHPVDNSSNMR